MDGDLSDAERRGQTYADADCTTAAAVGCKLVEYPSTRRPVWVSDNERSDWQNEYQVVEEGLGREECGGGQQHNAHHDRRDAPPESQHGDDDEDQDGIPDQRSRTSEEAVR